MLAAADATLYSITGLGFVVLGVVILIRYAGFPDLTVDGSFTLAAALFAASVKAGTGSILAYAIAISAGAISGLLTWSFNQGLGMGRVVSGVLAMILLILAAPYVAGASIGLLIPDSFHLWLNGLDSVSTSWLADTGAAQLHVATTAFWLSVLFLLGLGFRTAFSRPTGLRIRYLGSARSPTLVEPTRRRWFLLAALMVGNGLVGLGAAVESVRRGGFSANMGLGVLLSALAIMILGEAMLKALRRRDFLHVGEQLLALVLGLAVFGAAVQAILRFGPDNLDVRLASTLMLVVLLGIAARFFPNSAKLF